ncbi:uncharacterized protein LOC123021908 [Varanus komodoensis]|uniref:uncharacterized protein LOC123021908 n=1 Tax=Varanus komodoensis TaxID=61221 RepID=UPI001CF7D722|nr:uncharacterized protein LOC123021908 [Varanus komodoensis]
MYGRRWWDFYEEGTREDGGRRRPGDPKKGICEKVLRCVYINARSLGNKQEELEAPLAIEGYDLVGITETWPCSSGVPYPAESRRAAWATPAAPPPWPNRLPGRTGLAGLGSRAEERPRRNGAAAASRALGGASSRAGRGHFLACLACPVQQLVRRRERLEHRPREAARAAEPRRRASGHAEPDKHDILLQELREMKADFKDMIEDMKNDMKKLNIKIDLGLG